MKNEIYIENLMNLYLDMGKENRKQAKRYKKQSEKSALNDYSYYDDITKEVLYSDAMLKSVVKIIGKLQNNLKDNRINNN